MKLLLTITVALALFAAFVFGVAHAQMSGGSMNGSVYMNGNPIYGAGALTTSSTATVVGALGVGSTPAALATFGTCAAGKEGLFATETNSTAACAAGATATASGTTHCAIYCNGTNWVQLGI